MEPRGPAPSAGRRGLGPHPAFALAIALLASRDAWPAATDGEWIAIPPPTERRVHTAIHDPVRDRMVVFGGADYWAPSHTMVWALSLTGELSWSPIPATGLLRSRWGHSAIYDPVRDRMVVFGGSEFSGPLNDVLELSLDETPTWRRVSARGTPPAPRWPSSAIYDPVRDRMLIFGGCCSTPSDVWALSLGDTATWSPIVPDGTAPVGGTAIYDPVRDRMVIYGAGDGSELWALSFTGSPVWTRLAPEGTTPPIRSGFTLIHDPVEDRLVLFGGQDGAYSLQPGTWALSLAGIPTWSVVDAGGVPPVGRHGHTAIYAPTRRQMVVFGGDDMNDALRDLWTLSLDESPSWSPITPAMTAPTGTDGHSAVYDAVRDRMLVCGDFRGGHGNDVWALSLAGQPSWSPVSPAGVPPTVRAGHGAIYDPLRDRMVVCGGRSSTGPATTEVWSLSLAGIPAWSQISPEGTPPCVGSAHEAFYDPVRDRMLVIARCSSSQLDVWALSLDDNPTWSLLSPTGHPPYTWNCLAYDSRRDRIVVFSGSEDGELVEQGVLSLAGVPAWGIITTTGTTPVYRPGSTAIYDPVRDRMVVFAGEDTDRGDHFNEVCALSFGDEPTWRLLRPAGQPPFGRSGHTAIFDPIRDRMVVFAGYATPLGDPAYPSDTWALAWGGAPAPTSIALVGAEVEAGRVILTWYGSGAPGLLATVERRMDATDWEQLAIMVGDGTGRFRYEDRAVTAGLRYAYRLSYTSDGATRSTPEHWVQVPAARLALHGLGTNPALGEFEASFSLASAERATLEVFDLAGRRRLTLDVGAPGPGPHRLELSQTRGLPAGVYVIRLTQAGRTASRRGVLLR